MEFDLSTVDESISHYDENGYAILRDVFDRELIQQVNGHFEWLNEEKFPDMSPEILGKGKYMKQDPFWIRLAADTRLLDVVERILGPNVALFNSSYFAKAPEEGEQILWHQDGCYWPLDPVEAVTVWVALTETTPENGCLRVLSGTHEMELQEPRERTDVENFFDTGVDESLVDESKAVDLELDPGDLSIHHPNVIHGSTENTSDVWRRGLAFRYVPAEVRTCSEDPFGENTYDEDHSLRKPVLLRGEPDDANEYVPWPVVSDRPEWEEYNRRARRMNDRIAERDCLTEL